MIQILLVKAIILLILIFVWKKAKKPSEKIATVRKSSIITKTVKRDSEKLLFEYRVVEVDALQFAQKVKSNIKIWDKTKGNNVISKTRGLGKIIDVTQSENNILLISIIFNGDELLTNPDSFIDGYFKTIFISNKLLTDLVIQNEEIITFPIEDNKPNTVVADKKLADAKIAADKAVADKILADAKITDYYEVSAVDFAKYADKNIEIWSEVSY